ncbi:MAG TPA: tRNA (guanine(10)-N(2))-dimethyltransferase [Candidatus Thermoplasmatota archaeon]|nr:tRNA (guanine(10)-N(2))-dimethyltransferase [Candidatus Thermoplasmatota archaeon]
MEGEPPTELTLITEGATRLRVALPPKERGPGTRTDEVFFNPAMALNRDLSIAVLAAETARRGGAPMKVLDGLAATGARGLRFAVEVPGHQVTLNDHDPRAVARIEDNARLNNVLVRVTRRSLGGLLGDEGFDWIDVDPFGSPAPFTGPATGALHNHGILALTATDAPALNGVYVNACRRRYLAEPLRCPFGHEVALRLLAAHAVREAAKHEVALRPLLSHATDHYYRLYLRLEYGAGRADKALASLRYATFCKACGDRRLVPEPPKACPACEGPVKWGGPLWAEGLMDAAFLQEVKAATVGRTFQKPRDLEKALPRFMEEAEAPPLLYDVHEIAPLAGVDVPKTPLILEALRARGYRAALTHLHDRGIKTDATAREFAEVLRALGRQSGE